MRKEGGEWAGDTRAGRGGPGWPSLLGREARDQAGRWRWRAARGRGVLAGAGLGPAAAFQAEKPWAEKGEGGPGAGRNLRLDQHHGPPTAPAGGVPGFRAGGGVGSLGAVPEEARWAFRRPCPQPAGRGLDIPGLASVGRHGVPGRREHGEIEGSAEHRGAEAGSLWGHQGFTRGTGWGSLQ